MSDPAIDAAHRAIENNVTNLKPRLPSQIEVAAAREALAPIRKLHRSTENGTSTPAYCVGCAADWPCDTARLVYPEDEL